MNLGYLYKLINEGINVQMPNRLLGILFIAISIIIIPNSNVLADSADYLIHEKGGTYYARNNVTGRDEFSNSDAGKVINSAIEVFSDTGGSVIIASGVYLTKETINLRSSIGIYGRRGAVLKLDHNGDVIVGKKVEGIELKGFEIDGNKKKYSGGGVHLFDGSKHNLISELIIRDCKGNGILLSDGETSLNSVVGNRIENCEGAGIALYSSATDTVISENYVYRTRHHGIILSHGGSNCQIANNKIVEAGYFRQDENDFCHGIAVDAWGIEPYGRNNVITGNIIIDPYMAGIEVADIQDYCVISNNIVDNPKNSYGIYFGGGMAPSYNATIVGNIVKNAADSGIRVGSPYGKEKVTANVTIGNNFVSDSRGHGIQIDTVGNVNISSNICLNNNTNGIYIAGENAELNAYRINVIGNQCYDDRSEKLQRYGLYLKNARDVMAIGNFLSQNKLGDIHKENVSNYLQDNNQ
jgi:parallel beta-helix repeat protein